jgi:hypothetical protein
MIDAISTAQRLDLRFITATIEVPQSPVSGVAVMGETAFRSIQDQLYTPEQLVAAGLEEGSNRLQKITAATMAVHGLSEIGQNAGLSNALRFAYDLVRSGIISTAVEYGRGSEGVHLPAIERAGGAVVDEFLQSSLDPQFIDDVRLYSKAAATVLTAPGSIPQLRAEQYQSEIVTVSAHFAAQPPSAERDRARMGEMDAARKGLRADIRPFVAEAITNALPDVGDVSATVHNLTRWKPGESLVNEYFGRPQQG